MFYLYPSNRTENLLECLAALIQADPSPSPFAREHIVIQSQGMERMICQSMADKVGCWCSYYFHLPVNFFQDIGERLEVDSANERFARDHLCWSIEKLLRHIADPVFTPILKYLSGSRAAVKRYQLARQLANLFDQYQLMRPAMLAAWEKLRLTSDDINEPWQMHLWHRLVKENGGRHRGQVLQAVTEKLISPDSGELWSKPPPRRIAFFGLHTLPPLFIDFLSGLSQHTDIHLFLLSPCSGYWGDMVGGQQYFATIQARTAHPLLVSLGAQGRDFQELLLDKVVYHQEIPAYHELENPQEMSLLHRLQADLQKGEISEAAGVRRSDASLRVVSCHSKIRELEVLRDHILDLLNRDHELELRDIIVMAPDIQVYAPYIPALFDSIQHTIADRSLFEKNPYLSVFSQFLSLLQGRFGWSEVMDLFEKKEVFPNFGIFAADLDTLNYWLIGSGIRWGLSADTRRMAGYEFSANSFRAGIDRLLLGYAMGDETPFGGLSPYPAVEGSDAVLLGGLSEFVYLMERCQRQFATPRSLTDWAEILQKSAIDLFGIGESRDYLEMNDIIASLGEYGRDHSDSVDFEVVAQWFAQSVLESRSISGFLRGQLTFCSMLPMRSIPFKALCLLGLNYGEFPRNDRYITFDLLKRYPQKGDRSFRADDRYQFLEALLSARQWFYLSYVGQSLVNNDTIPPSVVLTELLEVLDNWYGVSDLIEYHPLHGFSSRYFEKKSGLFSYNSSYLEIARSLRQPEITAEPWWDGSVPITEEDKIIEIADLFSFYRNPQTFFLTRRLGVPLAEERAAPVETEAFESVGLEAYLTDSYLLATLQKGGDMAYLGQKLQEDGIWPLGKPGNLLFAHKIAELREFAAQLDELITGEQLINRRIDLLVSGCQIAGNLGSINENGVYLWRYAKMQGKDVLHCYLHHLLVNCGSDKVIPTTLVMREGVVCRFDKQQAGLPTLEDFVEFFLDGCRRPSSLLIEPGAEYCRQTLKKRARISPLEKASQSFRKRLENGYEPAWSLLYDQDKVLGEPFVDSVESLLLPLWRLSHG